jgi:hypothetical protein
MICFRKGLFAGLPGWKTFSSVTTGAPVEFAIILSMRGVNLLWLSTTGSDMSNIHFDRNKGKLSTMI